MGLSKQLDLDSDPIPTYHWQGQLQLLVHYHAHQSLQELNHSNTDQRHNCTLRPGTWITRSPWGPSLPCIGKEPWKLCFPTEPESHHIQLYPEVTWNRVNDINLFETKKGSRRKKDSFLLFFRTGDGEARGEARGGGERQGEARAWGRRR